MLAATVRPLAPTRTWHGVAVGDRQERRKLGSHSMKAMRQCQVSGCQVSGCQVSGCRVPTALLLRANYTERHEAAMSISP